MIGIQEALNECQSCEGKPRMTELIDNAIHIECLNCGETVEERGAWLALRIWNGG